MKELFLNTPHKLDALLKKNGIPKCKIAGFTKIPPSRLYLILNGSAQPSAREAELLNGVERILQDEENNKQRSMI